MRTTTIQRTAFLPAVGFAAPARLRTPSAA
jgi:hypothetical protein